MSVSTEGSVRTGRIDEEDGRIAVSEVPWLSSGHRGELIRFEVGIQADPVLKMLASATPIFTMVSDDQVFSYSAPITDYSGRAR